MRDSGSSRVAWWALAVASLGLVALGGAWFGRVAGQEQGPRASVRLELEPAPAFADPGPEYLVGAEQTPGGTHFFWADFSVGGESNRFRLYFDREDNDNFHFLDRDGEQVALGLREGGVEQTLVAASLPTDAPGPLRVARHGSSIGVFRGRCLVASAFDDRHVGGTAGVRNRHDGALLTIHAEARDEIHFADDFMREDNSSALWKKVRCGEERGDFYIKSLRHPLLSANAFAYLGMGRGSMSVAGQSWWSNYRFQASLRGPEHARLGLVFAYQDERNYGLFRWTARPVQADGTPTGPGQRELVRVRDGKEEVLQSQPGGYLPNQFYAADLLVTHARLAVSIDGHPLMEVHDPWLASGSVGFWCDVELPGRVALDPKAAPFAVNSLWELMNQHAVFDDVKVTTVSSFEDDFRHAGALGRGWLVGTGTWKVETSREGQPGVLAARPGPWATKSLIGDRNWSRYEADVTVDPGAGLAGVVFLYRDESNYFLARTDGRSLELLKASEGAEQARTIDRAKLRDPSRAVQDGFVRLNAQIKDDHILVKAEDGTSVEAFESGTSLRGRAGLWAQPGPGSEGRPARFRRFRLRFLEQPQQMVTTNAIFEDEASMRNWTNRQEEWLRPSKPLVVDGRPVNLYWHSSQFPGDVELEIEPREILEEEHEAALSVNKSGSEKNNGYIFKYHAGIPAEDGKKVTRLEILRNGEAVASKDLPDGAVPELTTLSFRRAGKYLIGKLNGRPRLTWRDDRPLEGTKVAYYTKGMLAKIEASKITSEHFYDEPFSSAPTAWRTAGYAVAEVTNRWQCDPRWSFFSLKNDRAKGKPAVLWNKKLYDGDLTLEWYVGNKMETERGPIYTYARDINLTICSDGHDLTKGYTFMFGGENNQASMILRNGVEVKRENVTVPTTKNFHHHWFYIRLEKRGNRLTYRVDRYFDTLPEGSLVYEDPEPLTGKHIALWTYDHALMIGRVRISGEGGLEWEAPDMELEALKTTYDK
ncbi:MAG: hypothetical protein M5U26_29340 [Planctomycetota bacterium]|nr:hypothetical protein [Planctomycetota bacterium]